MPFQIVQGDLTTFKVDAIVNAANIELKRGGGVCGAIFSTANSKKLQEECDKIGYCPTGSAVITDGYDLPAKYIIHAVGPIWQGGNQNEEKLLYSAYKSSMLVALENNLTSIAFPLISSGIYGYPKDQVTKIAISAISDFLKDSDMMVYLVIYDRDMFIVDGKLKKKVQEYTERHFINPDTGLKVTERVRSYNLKHESICLSEESLSYSKCNNDSLEYILDKTGETFSAMLLRLIDENNLSDPEVYKRANIDRKLFSKIRSKPNYKPSKNTAISLAIALNLNLEQTEEFLKSAGYALSPGSRGDLIIEYFIKNSEFNIFKINEILFSMGETLLGAS